jgi:hypothetical protein
VSPEVGVVQPGQLPQLGLREVLVLAQLAQALRKAFQRLSHIQHSSHQNGVRWSHGAGFER